MPLHPTVLWAQRTDVIYVTVELVDIKDPKIDITSERFHFKGKGGTEQQEYECEFVFSKPVDPTKIHKVLTSRELFLTIDKADSGYWDRLYQGSRLNFIKVDFNKWKDEDEQDDDIEPAGPSGGNMPDMANLASMMGGGGGAGAGGMPDFASMMGGAGGAGGGMPDFASMMGGAGGMPDLSSMMGGQEKDNEQDEDDKQDTK